MGRETLQAPPPTLGALGFRPPPPWSNTGQKKDDLRLSEFRELCDGIQLLTDEILAENSPKFSLRECEAEILEFLELDHTCTDYESPTRSEWLQFSHDTGITNRYLDRAMVYPGREDVKEVFFNTLKRVVEAEALGVELPAEDLSIVIVGKDGLGASSLSRLYAKFLISLRVVQRDKVLSVDAASQTCVGDQRCITKCIQQEDEIELVFPLESKKPPQRMNPFPVWNSHQPREEPDEERNCVVMGNAQFHSKSVNGLLDHLPNKYHDTSRAQTILIMVGDFPAMDPSSGPNVKSDPDSLPIIRLQGFTTTELAAICKAEIRKRSNFRIHFDSTIVDETLLECIKGQTNGRIRKAMELDLECIEQGASSALRRQRTRIILEQQAATTNTGMLVNPKVMTKDDLQTHQPLLDVGKSPSWRELEGMIGPAMQEFRESIRTLVQFENHGSFKASSAGFQQLMFDKVIIGPPGSGKSTAATLYGQILGELGIFGRNVKTVSAVSLTTSKTGESEEKLLEHLEEIGNGVLILDDLHTADPGPDEDSKNHHLGAVTDVLVSYHKKRELLGLGSCIILVGDEHGMRELYRNSNAGFSRRFPLEMAVKLCDLRDEELHRLLQMTLNEKRILTDERAIESGLKALVRDKNRPNFGNGVAVNLLVATAVLRCSQRTWKEGQNEDNVDKTVSPPQSMALQPRDFDPNHDRLEGSVERFESLFQGFVDFGPVITTFQNYAYTAIGMKPRGIDPRLYLPFTFVFKGPPGTGKTSSARKLGQIYYDLGFLSSTDVVECSVSDLIGEFVGHTGPKVLRTLDRALGKVLFIDEAYRLRGDMYIRDFSYEAVGELMDALTKPKYERKLVIVLAGYNKEMNALLMSNPGFQSRFPTEIEFPPLTIDGCISHLQRCIAKLDIEIEGVDEQQKEGSRDESSELKRVRALLTKLSACRNWASARSVEKIAEIIISQVFKRCALENNTTGLLRVTMGEVEVVLSEVLRDTIKHGRV